MTKIHIILPNRIGDSILTLPSLLCLKQLLNKYRQYHVEVTVFSHYPLIRYFQALNLFEFRTFNLFSKFASWINIPDKAYFLSTTSKNIGYHAKTSYGLSLPNKKHVHYDIDLPYLSILQHNSELPDDLFYFLQSYYSLPVYSIKRFGICLEFGFSVQQIIDEFRFDNSSLLTGKEYFDNEPMFNSEYVVFCMEAANNKRHAAYRRWNEENFFVLAEKLYADYGVESIFIGLKNQPRIMEKPYFKDMRGKLNLDQILQLLNHSRGYFGNDTGPLHLANLLRKRSIGIYPSDGAIAYRPLFPEFNRAYINTQTPEEIYPFIEFLISEDSSPVDVKKSNSYQHTPNPSCTPSVPCSSSSCNFE